jgi:hypothetical protein
MRRLVAACLAVSLSGPATAWAQARGGPPAAPPAAAEAPAIDEATRGSARELGEQGNALFAAGDFAGALDKYERANALVPVPTLGVRIARCLVALGRLVEASERYLAVQRAGLPPDPLPVHQRALDEARAERDALLPRIPSIVVTVSPVGAEVLVDGAALPPALIGEKRVVDPGAHVVEARAGAATKRVEVAVAEGATVPVHVAIEGAPAAPRAALARPPTTAEHADDGASPWPIVGWSAVGVGGAAAIVGVVTGISAMSQRGDLEERCGEELACPPEAHDDAGAYNDLRTVSGVTFFAGLGLAAAGVAIVLVDPGGAGDAEVVAGPGHVGVRGRF